MSSRLITGALALAMLTAMTALPAHATGYPEKNITFLIAYGPGGGFDTITRKLSPYIEKYLPHKVKVIPKNLPGGRGKKSAGYIYKRKPDGYNILMFNMPGHALPNIIGAKAAYDVRKITWLARVAQFKYVMVVNGKADNFKTFDDVLNMKRQIKQTSLGPGTTANLASSIIWAAFKKDVKYITGYKSSAQYALGVIRGDGDITILAKGSFRKYIGSKKKKRRALRDLKPILEITNGKSEFGVKTSKSYGLLNLDTLGGDRIIGTTPGLPRKIKDILATALYKAITNPEFVAWADKVGRPTAPLNAADAKKKVTELFTFYSQFKDLLATSAKTVR